MYHDGVTIGAGTAYFFGEPEVALNLSGVHDAQSMIHYKIIMCWWPLSPTLHWYHDGATIGAGTA
jgi:hypothetical protein